MIKLRDHGGIFGGGNSDILKYPVRNRVVGSGSISPGDYVMTRTDGTVVKASAYTQDGFPIVPKGKDTGIELPYGFNLVGQDYIKMFEIDGFLCAVRITKLNTLYFEKLNMENGEMISRNSSLLAIGTKLVPALAVVKISNNKVFIKYRDDISTTNIKVHGMIAEIKFTNGIPTVTVVNDIILNSYTVDSGIEDWRQMHVFNKSNGVTRLWFVTGLPYSGGHLRYIDITDNQTNISLAIEYTKTGAELSNFGYYARTNSVQIITETASSSTFWVYATGYVNSNWGAIYKITLNHDSNTSFFELLRGTTVRELNVYPNQYGWRHNFKLSKDKTFLYFFLNYDTQDDKSGITMAKMAINADGTIEDAVYCNYGRHSAVGNGQMIDMDLREIPGGKFLASFAGNDGTYWRSFTTVLDATKHKASGFVPTTYYTDALVSSSGIPGEIYQLDIYPFFFQIGWLATGSNYMARCIDLDYVPVTGMAKTGGSANQSIQVNQFVNHV